MLPLSTPVMQHLIYSRDGKILCREEGVKHLLIQCREDINQRSISKGRK